MKLCKQMLMVLEAYHKDPECLEGEPELQSGKKSWFHTMISHFVLFGACGQPAVTNHLLIGLFIKPLTMHKLLTNALGQVCIPVKFIVIAVSTGEHSWTSKDVARIADKKQHRSYIKIVSLPKSIFGDARISTVSSSRTRVGLVTWPFTAIPDPHRVDARLQEQFLRAP